MEVNDKMFNFTNFKTMHMETMRWLFAYGWSLALSELGSAKEL